MRLLTTAHVRDLLERTGVRPTKTLGQNFVTDPGTVRRIVRTAGVEPGDVVVEVGPGLGSLTLGLLEAGARVVAVEIDPVLAAQLPETVAAHAGETAGNLRVIGGDAMQVSDLAYDGEAPRHLVANLPYNVAVPVLLTMLERFPSLESVLVMVQAEVADRIAAPPGSKTYGIPSAKAAWYAQASRAGSVGRSIFWPTPNVDSALVRLVRRDPPAVGASREATFAVVDAAFAQRRKTLRGALGSWAGSPARAEEVLVAAGVDPKRRGETVSIEEFAAIAAADARLRSEATRAHWEEMYGERDQVWSGRVNAQLAALAGSWRPGRALELGAGEGGDAIWLAERGWDVVAVDISQTALERGRAAAAERGLTSIQWHREDLEVWQPPSAEFDLVTAHFLQSNDGPLADVGARAAGAVAPGGRMLVVTHAEVPPWSSPVAGHEHHHADLPTPEQLLASLRLDPGWSVEVCEVRERTQERDGAEHVLRDSVVVVRRA